MPRVSICGSTSLCNKKTSTLQTCVEQDETVGIGLFRRNAMKTELNTFNVF